MNHHDTPEWIRILRGFPAHCIFTVLHWLYFALLPYAGDWAYRKERREARREARAALAAARQEGEQS